MYHFPGTAQRGYAGREAEAKKHVRGAVYGGGHFPSGQQHGPGRKLWRRDCHGTGSGGRASGGCGKGGFQGSEGVAGVPGKYYEETGK